MKIMRFFPERFTFSLLSFLPDPFSMTCICSLTLNSLLTGSQLCVLDTDYMVEFKTANEPDAGTDSDVYFKLLGEGGETETVQLGDNSDGSHFQPGQTDKFNTRGKNVGKVSEIKLDLFLYEWGTCGTDSQYIHGTTCCYNSLKTIAIY